MVLGRVFHPHWAIARFSRAYFTTLRASELEVLARLTVCRPVVPWCAEVLWDYMPVLSFTGPKESSSGACGGIMPYRSANLFASVFHLVASEGQLVQHVRVWPSIDVLAVRSLLTSCASIGRTQMCPCCGRLCRRLFTGPQAIRTLSQSFI